MKNKIISTKLISRTGWFGSVVAALVLLATAASSPAQVLPPSSLPYGLSYQEWSAKWWQWFVGQDTNRMELVGGPGICDGPASRVRFLTGAPGNIIVTHHVTIPAETPLFFTVLSAEADNTGCPMTTFTADQLAAIAAGNWSVVTKTSCTIDGVAVAGLSNPTNTVYLVQTPAFSYTTSEFGDFLPAFNGTTCIPGGTTIYPAVADGVYLMLSPLKPGKHSIHIVGEVGPEGAYLTQDITYDITVSKYDGFRGY